MQKMLLGATLLLGLSAFALFFYQQHPSPQQLAQTYLHNSQFSIYGHRGLQIAGPQIAENEENHFFERIHWQTEQGQDLVAIGLLEDFLQKKPQHAEAQLQLGILKLRQRQPLSALPHLQQAQQSTSPLFALDAAWFLALLKLQDGQVADCKKQLQKVLDGRGNYHSQAANLLQELG